MSDKPHTSLPEGERNRLSILIVIDPADIPELERFYELSSQYSPTSRTIKAVIDAARTRLKNISGVDWI